MNLSPAVTACGIVVASMSTVVGARAAVEVPVPVPSERVTPAPVNFEEGDWQRMRFFDGRVSALMPCSEEEVTRRSRDDKLGAIYECKKQRMTFGVALRLYDASDSDSGFDSLLQHAKETANGSFDEFSWFGHRAFRLTCKKDVCYRDADGILVEYIDLAPGEMLMVGANETYLPEGQQPQGRVYAHKFYDSLEFRPV